MLMPAADLPGIIGASRSNFSVSIESPKTRRQLQQCAKYCKTPTYGQIQAKILSSRVTGRDDHRRDEIESCDRSNFLRRQLLSAPALRPCERHGQDSPAAIHSAEA